MRTPGITAHGIALSTKVWEMGTTQLASSSAGAQAHVPGRNRRQREEWDTALRAEASLDHPPGSKRGSRDLGRACDLQIGCADNQRQGERSAGRLLAIVAVACVGKQRRVQKRVTNRAAHTPPGLGKAHHLHCFLRPGLSLLSLLRA